MTVLHHSHMQPLHIPTGLCCKEWKEYLKDLDTDKLDNASIKKVIKYIVVDIVTVEEAEDIFDDLDLLFSDISQFNRG